MYSNNMLAQIFSIVPFFLILFVMVAVFLAEFDVRKNLRKLASRNCSTCGASFGYEVIQEARAKSKKPYEKKQRPMKKWDFMCPACHKSFFVKPDDWVLHENI